MIFSLRSSLFVAMTMAVTVQQQASALDPDWFIANERYNDVFANAWWPTFQSTGGTDPGITYYGLDPPGTWTFGAPNTWDGFGFAGKGFIRMTVSGTDVKRTWMKATIDGVPGAGDCDILDGIFLKFNGQYQIPLNDGFYVFVDGVYSGVGYSVSAGTGGVVNGVVPTFLQWATQDGVAYVPIGGSVSGTYEIAIAVEEYAGFGGFFDIEFDPVLSTPAGCCNDCGGAMGDPHFQTWSGEWYDYHGICDLVLLSAPGFSTGLGLDVHIRTKPRYEYSYIEAAAIKVGDDVFEVGSFGSWFYNGVHEAALDGVLLGGIYSIEHEQVNKKKHVFTIKTGGEEAMIFKTYKDMVSFQVEKAGPENFETATGMMGSFDGGLLKSRDGAIMENHDAFGQEWQVTDADGNIFQAPSPYKQCVPPSSIHQSRRLGESSVSEEAAAMACAKYADESKRDMCIFDVIAMADLEVADVHGAF